MPSRIINACKQDSIVLLRNCDIHKRDIWGRNALYYAVMWSAHACILWLHRQGVDLYGLNEVKGNREDLIDTALRTKNPETIQVVCDLWKRPLKLNKYLDVLFKGKTDILRYFITRFGISSVKGLERIICRKATVAHYKLLLDQHVCFSLLEALRYTLVYNKQKEFLFLMKYIRCGEQLNAIFTTAGHSTVNLLAIASVTGNFKACVNLLEKGADPKVLINNSNHETMTTLHAVCNNKYTPEDLPVMKRITKLIVQHMSKDIKNAEGRTALEFAKERCNSEIAGLIE